MLDDIALKFQRLVPGFNAHPLDGIRFYLIGLELDTNNKIWKSNMIRLRTVRPTWMSSFEANMIDICNVWLVMKMVSPHVLLDGKSDLLLGVLHKFNSGTYTRTARVQDDQLLLLKSVVKKGTAILNNMQQQHHRQMQPHNQTEQPK